MWVSLKYSLRAEVSLSCMAFSVYEVIRVSCLSRSWFVYVTRQTRNANDFVNAKTHAREKPLLAG